MGSFFLLKRAITFHRCTDVDVRHIAALGVTVEVARPGHQEDNTEAAQKVQQKNGMEAYDSTPFPFTTHATFFL